MSMRVFSLCLGSIIAAALAGCAPSSSPGGEPAEVAPEQQESEVNAATCDGTELFVEQGTANDLRKTVAPQFIREGYYVVVPGAVMAFDSYGGDIVNTVLGANASATRVFDPNPGGGFYATVGGFPTGDKFQKRGMAAAQKLFDAMTNGTETSSTENGWTTTKRASKLGTFSCEVRTQGGAARDASCRFEKLLFTRVTSQSGTNPLYCVR